MVLCKFWSSEVGTFSLEGVWLPVPWQIQYMPLTLLKATLRADDIGGCPFFKPVKHRKVALFNAYTRKGFSFDSWEVKALLLEALVPEDASAAQDKQFEQANVSCV
jgi:hypothetical protein